MKAVTAMTRPATFAAVARAPGARSAALPPGGIAPATAYANAASLPSYPPAAFLVKVGWMAITARMPPPGDGDPGRTWKRFASGQIIPCGLGPGGGTWSGLRVLFRSGTMSVGMIGRYVPPAPATSLPWVTAPIPWLDGPGCVPPPPPFPPPAALTAATGSSAVTTPIAHARRIRGVTVRTTPPEGRLDPGNSRRRPRTRCHRARGPGGGHPR